MPPLKPGKIVSKTGKVVNAPPPPPPPKGGPGAKTQTKDSKPTKYSPPPPPPPKGGPGAKTQTKDSKPTNYSTPYVGHYGQTPPPVDKKTDVKKSSGPSVNPNVGGGTDSDPGETNTPMDPTPDIPKQNPVPDTIVKPPTRNVTDISSLVPQFNAEQIKRILFENLSAIELSRIERHDTIEGIDQRYSIISNLSEIRKKYQQTKQLTIMDKFKPLTSVFTINIQDKIPKEDYLILENLNATYKYLDENNQLIDREKGYYYVDTNGDLVIELINIEKSEQIEIQIDTNGTIYKVELWLQQMVKTL